MYYYGRLNVNVKQMFFFLFPSIVSNAVAETFAKVTMPSLMACMTFVLNETLLCNCFNNISTHQERYASFEN